MITPSIAKSHMQPRHGPGWASETVSVELERDASISAVIDAPPQESPLRPGLPVSNRSNHHLPTENDRPQPYYDRDSGGGMAVTVGRLRPCEVLDIRWSCYPTIPFEGAAAPSWNAELMVAEGLL